MTFNSLDHAYVWTWLPGEAHPVVMGQVRESAGRVTFHYGKSYLANPNAISPNTPELPLVEHEIEPLSGLSIPGCIADARPDSWGQRVIENRLLSSGVLPTTPLTNITYLLHSGSDRVGALDFQESSTSYVARTPQSASLQELAEAAQHLDEGVPLTPALEAALTYGTAIGGARPKVLIDASDRKYVAKFSSTNDTAPVVKAEFIAMKLAHYCDINVATSELTQVAGKDVLLVERFDRELVDGSWCRRGLMSALTLMELDEYAAHHDGSYAKLAETIRVREFERVQDTVHELFARITFNILCGNTDDHARNHAAIRYGDTLRLSPAYDIAPLPRAGGESRQIMAIGSDGFRMSQLSGCIDRAGTYLLTANQAREIVDHQITTIRQRWDETCDMAELSQHDRDRYWGTAFLNPYALIGY